MSGSLPYIPEHTLVFPPTKNVNKHTKYNDAIAIDIVLLPPTELDTTIKTNINQPLQEKMNSFPLDTTHYPHMSITHTIVPYNALELICAQLMAICCHSKYTIQQIIAWWRLKVLTNNHPLYTAPDTIKPMPYHQNDGSNDDAPLKQLEKTYFDPICLKLNQGEEEVITIDNILGTQYYKNNSIPLTFDWTTYGCGPAWDSYDLKQYQQHIDISLQQQQQQQPNCHNNNDDNNNNNITTPCDVIDRNLLKPIKVHLPWIGYPNVVDLSTGYVDNTTHQQNDSQQNNNNNTPNGLNMRILHDIITTMMSQYRVFIDECVSPTLHEKDEEKQFILDVAQELYFTGKTIQPSQPSLSQSIKQPTIRIDYNTILKTNQNNNNNNKGKIFFLTNQNNDNNDDDNDNVNNNNNENENENENANNTIEKNNNNITNHFDYQDYEPIEPSGILYTNLFDRAYCNHKYNPHITIGSGPIELLQAELPRIFNSLTIEKNENEQQTQQQQQHESIAPNVYKLPQPIPMDLSKCTIAVFVLGSNGSARYPIFKTKLNLGNN
eukprot:UN04767